MYAGGSEQINVSIFVSHLVATYDPKAFVQYFFSDEAEARKEIDIIDGIDQQKPCSLSMSSIRILRPDGGGAKGEAA